jgi:UDP-glucose 4-epimerase
MSILITGGGGFLAKNLAVDAKRMGKVVNVVSRSDGDLSDPIYTQRILNIFNPMEVWHLAAKATIKPDDDNPSKIIDDNIKATHNICHYAPRGCIIKFASSIVVYGDAIYKPFSESDPCFPTSIYGITKLTSENIIKYYANLDKIKAVIFRISATVGPHLTHGMLHDFVRKIKENKTNLEVFGDSPGSIKPFSHVSDVSFAFNKDYKLSSFSPVEIVNISPQDILSVEDVAHIVLDTMNEKRNIVWLGKKSTWAGDNNKLWISNSRYRSVVYSEPIPSKEAIKLAVLEILKNG